MGRFFEAVKAGVAGFKSANDPAEFSVAGRPVRCQIQAVAADTNRRIVNPKPTPPLPREAVCSMLGESSDLHPPKKMRDRYAAPSRNAIK